MQIRSLGDALRWCVGCGVRGGDVCPACLEELRESVVDTAEIPPGIPVTALFRYDTISAAVVLALKNGGLRRLAARLGPAMAELAGPADLVTWAPTTAARRTERGYDHGELLARSVASALGVPARLLVRRLGRTTQHGRAGAERRRVAPAFSPTAAARRVPAGARVLVVDDVCTTGATLSAAAIALLEAGVAPLEALVVARADQSTDEDGPSPGLKEPVRPAETFGNTGDPPRDVADATD